MTERGKFASRRPFRTRLPGEEQVVDELRRRAPKRGMRKSLAHDIGVSEPTLAGVATGHRPVSQRLGEALGFRLVSRWERITDDEHPPG